MTGHDISFLIDLKNHNVDSSCHCCVKSLILIHKIKTDKQQYIFILNYHCSTHYINVILNSIYKK